MGVSLRLLNGGPSMFSKANMWGLDAFLLRGLHVVCLPNHLRILRHQAELTRSAAEWNVSNGYLSRASGCAGQFLRLCAYYPSVVNERDCKYSLAQPCSPFTLHPGDSYIPLSSSCLGKLPSLKLTTQSILRIACNRHSCRHVRYGHIYGIEWTR